MSEPEPRWRLPMTIQERALYDIERANEHEDDNPLHFVGDLIASHHYRSTHCIHQIHGQCKRTCKICGAPCDCSCHGGEGAR